jgi:hypothetical protein
MCTTEKLAARASSVQICPSCSDGNIASLSVPNTDCILLSKAYFHFITQLWDDDRDDDDKDTLVYLYNFHIASRSAFSRWSSGTLRNSGMPNFTISSASRRISLNKEFEHNVDKLLLWKQQLILKKKIASLQAI